MALKRKDFARRKAVDMIEEADKNSEEISHSDIKKVLMAPPYNMKKTAVYDMMDEFVITKRIIAYKRGKKIYYRRTIFLGRPNFLALFFSAFHIVGLVLFIIFYKKTESFDRYYGGIENSFFINHHHLIIAFIVIIVVTNILWAYLWIKHENILRSLLV